MKPAAHAMPRSTDLLDSLLAAIRVETPAAIALRRRLHASPELAHAEHATAARVAEGLGMPTRPAAETGLIARIGDASAAAVAVRAELDGLPIVEATDVPFASTSGAMHACGHDVHMAALVALVRAAAALEPELPSPLLAVFQPSEEAYPSGAEALAADAALEDAAIVVAAHLQPELEWGSVALDAGPVNASSDNVEIKIEGGGTHAAYPHRGSDPVLALAQTVVAVHALIGRRIDPLAAAVISVGELRADGAENVVPPAAYARATLRALQPADRQRLCRLVVEAVEGVARAHGCRGSVSFVEGEPALVNDAAVVEAVTPELSRAGFAPAPPWRSCGSDDLAFLSRRARLAMAFVGLNGMPGFEARPLHHPEFLPPDEAVEAVARVLACLYVGAASVAGRLDLSARAGA
ncbi:MAG TPA: amidohydrolase [Gaiellaceae bacterium]|nr:amidohydrolase [Gaiellaceae bacterium]